MTVSVPELDLYFELDEPDDAEALIKRVSEKLGVSPKELPPIEIKKKAIDARRHKVRILFTVGPREEAAQVSSHELKQVKSDPVLIIGAGPAGMFCAYELARKGIASRVLP